MRFLMRSRMVLVAYTLLIVMGVTLPIALFKLEWSLQDLTNSSKTSASCHDPNSSSHNNNRRRALRSQVTESGTRYTAFVYKPCAETFSFGYTWFTTNHFDIVCDVNDKSPMCTLHIENSQGYELLGEKSLNLWKLVHASPDSEEIIVKIDDDTIIQKHVLDDFVDTFARNKSCELAGMISAYATEFYWPLGRLYMFKKRALPPTGHLRWSNASYFNAYEDTQIGYLVGANSLEKVCDLDSDRFWHTGFEDKRVEIKFKFFSASCDLATNSTT